MTISQMRSSELALELRRRQITELLYTTDDHDVLIMLNEEMREIDRNLSHLRLELYGNLQRI